MRNFKLVIEYEGSEFSGWQRQKNGRSVQATLEGAIEAVTGEPVRVIGAGRTDAGVHAEGQVASFASSTALGVEELRQALNANLPEDVAIRAVEEAPEGFHARRSARGKTYVYTILNSRTRSPLLRRRALFSRRKLDVEAMKMAAESLEGEHDFGAFRSAGSAAKTTVRNLWKADVEKCGDLITVTLSANGFLYNMARAIVGTLIEVGRGKLAPAQVKEILASGDRSSAGPTAPAHGLCLQKVYYDEGNGG